MYVSKKLLLLTFIGSSFIQADSDAAKKRMHKQSNDPVYYATLVEGDCATMVEKPVTKDLYFYHLLKSLEHLVQNCKSVTDALAGHLEQKDIEATQELCQRLSVSINENNNLIPQSFSDMQALHAKALSKLLKRTKNLKEAIDQIHNKDLKALKTLVEKLKKDLAQELAVLQETLNTVESIALVQDEKLESVVNRVVGLELQLQLLTQEFALLKEDNAKLLDVLGSPTDESADTDDLGSVIAIDQAELSLISWLKTVYKQLRADDFIS